MAENVRLFTTTLSTMWLRQVAYFALALLVIGLIVLAVAGVAAPEVEIPTNVSPASTLPEVGAMFEGSAHIKAGFLPLGNVHLNITMQSIVADGHAGARGKFVLQADAYGGKVSGVCEFKLTSTNEVIIGSCSGFNILAFVSDLKVVYDGKDIYLHCQPKVPLVGPVTAKLESNSKMTSSTLISQCGPPLQSASKHEIFAAFEKVATDSEVDHIARERLERRLKRLL
jgi:hypothetical protein